MGRNRNTANVGENAVGHDSFLDVVTNIVGIMIVLVMVCGSRLRSYSEQQAKASAEQSISADLTSVEGEAVSLESEINRIDEQIAQVKRLFDVKQVERINYLTAKQLVEGELAKHENQLADNQKEALQLERQKTELLSKLGNIKPAEEQDEDEDVVELSNRPTPIADPVTGDELHFQISGGRIAYAPVMELVEAFKREAMDRIRAGRMRETLEGEVGPIEGFRLRYRLAERKIMGESGAMGSMVELERWELEPAETMRSETAEQALAADSRFRKRLARAGRRRMAVTFWTYPDSFSAYRALQEQLFSEGYTVAGRPLPLSAKISGSPKGTRSAGQ